MSTIWSILQVAVRPRENEYQNVVHSAEWQAVLRNTTDFVRNSGEVTFLPPLNNFISYGDLTEQQVLSWVKDILGTQAVLDIENALQVELIKLSNPSIVYLPLPWK